MDDDIPPFLPAPLGAWAQYALYADEEFGMWGGLDPRERRNLKRRRARRRAVGHR